MKVRGRERQREIAERERERERNKCTLVIFGCQKSSMSVTRRFVPLCATECTKESSRWQSCEQFDLSKHKHRHTHKKRAGGKGEGGATLQNCRFTQKSRFMLSHSHTHTRTKHDALAVFIGPCLGAHRDERVLAANETQVACQPESQCVRKQRDRIPQRLRDRGAKEAVPHIGWSSVWQDLQSNNSILKCINMKRKREYTLKARSEAK